MKPENDVSTCDSNPDIVANIAVVKPDKAEKLEVILIQVSIIKLSQMLNTKVYRTLREGFFKAK